MVMFIDQLINFLQDASIWPKSYWGHKLYLSRKSLISQLDEIKFTFKEKDSQSFRHIETLVTVLNQDIDELKLAMAMKNLTLDLAQSNTADEKLVIFEKLANQFLKRAQLFNHYEQSRSKLGFSSTQKKDFDQRLFSNEGMFYCLEYYLAVYKKLSELSESNEKNKFFETKEINLGFGELPGLKADFSKDEILEKFILPILDDTVREHLLISYYACKNAALHELMNIVEFEKVFKKFIYYLLLSFKENQIEKLTSKFFKPYGDQPTVESLLTRFESYE